MEPEPFVRQFLAAMLNQHLETCEAILSECEDSLEQQIRLLWWSIYYRNFAAVERLLALPSLQENIMHENNIFLTLAATNNDLKSVEALLGFPAVRAAPNYQAYEAYPIIQTAYNNLNLKNWGIAEALSELPGDVENLFQWLPPEMRFAFDLYQFRSQEPRERDSMLKIVTDSNERFLKNNYDT